LRHKTGRPVGRTAAAANGHGQPRHVQGKNVAGIVVIAAGYIWGPALEEERLAIGAEARLE
jgi:hypothetical protein